jgi:hypothetical protein
MASSGTYTYNPSLGELTLYAFNLIGIRSTSLLTEHMVAARMGTNLLLSDWSNDGPDLWKVIETPVTLVQGTATYSVPANTIMILDAYVTNTTTPTAPADRIITPISRSEYAAYPLKLQQGAPTVFWFDRLISPTITLWPVPDGTSYQLLNYYSVTQIQDAAFSSGQTLDLPYRWLRAFADGLAVQLARVWKPELLPALEPYAEKSYRRAAKQDVENANMYISPMLAGYYRP